MAYSVNDCVAHGKSNVSDATGDVRTVSPSGGQRPARVASGRRLSGREAQPFPFQNRRPSPSW